MRGKENLFRQLLRRDTLSEALPNVPVAELADDQRILIENHLGVIAYCCHKVIVKVHCGFMCIYGDDLYIHKMSREQLVITGRIDAVNFRERC